MPVTLDPTWLFRFDCHLFDAFGQRMDVAGLPRWSNPDSPSLRAGNHIGVRPSDGLIPSTLVQAFDAQRRDGADSRCIDIYGAPDSRDALCEEMGLERATDAPLNVVMFNRERTPAPLPNMDHVERTAPPVQEIDRAEWVDAVSAVHDDELAPWRRTRVMAEATLENAHFFAIRIGDATVACVARYDWPGASQIASLRTDPAFRNTGFGRACLVAAVHRAPSRVAYGQVDGANKKMLRVVERVGGEVVLSDPRRRYVGNWE